VYGRKQIATGKEGKEGKEGNKAAGYCEALRKDGGGGGGWWSVVSEREGEGTAGGDAATVR
jgi:hypothetical protein